MTNSNQLSQPELTDGQDEPSEAVSGKKRRLGGRSQRVQAAVFAAAIDVFLTNGFEGFRIMEVAERSGVNQTSIYRRWGNRETLLTEALLSRAEVDLAPPDTGSLRSDLVALLDVLQRFLQSPLGSAMLQISALTIDQPELVNYRQSYWLRRTSLIEIIFERAAVRGEISPTLDTSLILELLAGPVYVRALFTGQALPKTLIAKIVDAVLSTTDLFYDHANG